MAYCRLTKECDLYIYLSDTDLVCCTCEEAYFTKTADLIKHILENHKDDQYPDDLIEALEADAEFNDEYLADTDPDKFNKYFEAGRFRGHNG